MTTELEIIDTAIKVGLGALISGVTTYSVTMRNHSHEIRKTLLNDRKDLLKEAAIKIEKCSSLGNEFRDAIYQIAISKEANKEKRFWDAVQTLTTTLNLAKEARSLFFMIGQKELAELVEKYFETIAEEQSHYESYKLDYNVDVVNKITDKQSAIRKEILANISTAFESIYR